LNDSEPKPGEVPDDGPATKFRDAMTDGVGTWGPILGGVVAVGGGLAVVGTLLKKDGNANDDSVTA